MKKTVLTIGAIAVGWWLLKPKKDDLIMTWNGNAVDYKVIGSGKVINSGKIDFSSANVDTTIGAYRIKSEKKTISGGIIPILAIEIVVFKNSYEIVNGFANFNTKTIEYNRKV